jgi:hypothetical protein
MTRLRTPLGLGTKLPERPTGRPQQQAAFRPTLETLETRETPSSLAHATDSSGFLFGSDGSLKGSGDGPADYVLVGHGHNATYVYVGFP